MLLIYLAILIDQVSVCGWTNTDAQWNWCGCFE